MATMRARCGHMRGHATVTQQSRNGARILQVTIAAASPWWQSTCSLFSGKGKTMNTHPDPRSIAPYLFYDDVDRAVRFLETAFGFNCIFTSPAPEGGLAHAQLAHGTSKVMLGKVGAGLRPVKSARALDALHSGIYVYVEDVDAHCRHAREAGAEILLEPGDMHWGDRMYCALDSEGQFWMFARRLE
jgi:uncharacterized glyoxalase superfamily protein PhnB